MISLAGSLEGIGLPALVRFLVSLRPTGRLLVADDVWGGEVGFDRGQVVASSFGAERGLGALEAIALALPNGEFRFTGGTPPEGRDVDLPPAELDSYLGSLAEEQTAMARLLPSLAAVPRLIDPPGARAEGPDRITIDRSTLYSLLLVDGRRTVHAICEQRGERGAAQTLKELAWLADSGLVDIAGRGGVPGAEPESGGPPGPGGPPEGPPAPPDRGGGVPPPAPGAGPRPEPGPAAPPAEERGGGGGGPAPRASAFLAGPGVLALAGGPGLQPMSGQPLFAAPSGGGTTVVVPGRGLDLGDVTGGADELEEADETALRYWRRTLILAVLAAALLALSWWQQNHPALTTISQP